MIESDRAALGLGRAGRRLVFCISSVYLKNIFVMCTWNHIFCVLVAISFWIYFWVIFGVFSPFSCLSPRPHVLFCLVQGWWRSKGCISLRFVSSCYDSYFIQYKENLRYMLYIFYTCCIYSIHFYIIFFIFLYIEYIFNIICYKLL